MKLPRAITFGLTVAVVGLVVGALTLMVVLRPTTTSWWTDGQSVRVRAESTEPRDVLFAPPKELKTLAPPEIDLYAPAVSPDGSTLWFVRGRPGGSADLWFAPRTATGWGEAQPATAINTDADELGPALSPDGRLLYFHSDRVGGAGGYDLWVSAQNADGNWSEPINPGRHVNGPWHEYGAALDAGGLWFASNRPRPDEPVVDIDDAWSATMRADRARRDFDLYRSQQGERGLEPAQPITALNTEFDDGAPALSPAGDFMYFASNRPGGAGGFDLYRARLNGATFGSVEPIGSPVNTPGHELDPALDYGGFRLLYSHAAEPGAPYRLMESDSREVWRETETVAASIHWAAFLPALWWLLAALLAALLLWALWHLMHQRVARMGLAGRALIASALVHLLLLLLLAAWGVGNSLSNWSRGGQQVRLTSPSIGREIGTQLRGAVARDAAVAEMLPPSVVLALTAPLLTMTPVAFHEQNPEAVEVMAEALAPTETEVAPTREPPPTPPPEVDTASPTERADATVETPSSSAAARVEETQAAADPQRTEHRPAAVQPVSLTTTAQPDMVQVQIDATALPAEAALAQAESGRAASAEPVERPRRDHTVPANTHLKPGTPESAAPVTTGEVAQAELTPHDTAAESSITDAVPTRIASSEMVESATTAGALPATASLPPDNAIIAAAPTTNPPPLARPATDVAPAHTATASLPTTAAPKTQTEVARQTAQPETPEEMRAVNAAPPFASAPDSNQMPENTSVAALPIETDVTLLADVPSRAPAPDPDFSPEPMLAHAPPERRESAAVALPSDPARDAAATPVEAIAVVDAASLPQTTPQRTNVPVGAATSAPSIDRDLPAAALPVAPPLRDFPDDVALSAAAPVRTDRPPASPDTPPPSDRAFALDLPSSHAPTPTDSRPAPSAPAAPPSLIQPERLAVQPNAAPAPRAGGASDPAVTEHPLAQVELPNEVPLGVAEPLLANVTPLPMATPPTETVLPATPVLTLDLPHAALPAVNPYEHRQEEVREQIALEMGGSRETEAAVARALEWLARYQENDGSWDSDGFDTRCRCGDPSRVDVDIAVTALATLCFLACDHRPDRDGEYQDTVAQAVAWLVAHQSEDGALMGRESLYSHGIATLALSEAYAMTGDPALRGPVERAVNFIVRSRSPRGGWRYAPGQMGDTSVLGWQIMAMTSARRGGIHVPDDALTEGERWLRTVEDQRRPGRYGYQPRHAATPAMTAEGMFIQQLLGASPDDNQQRHSANYLTRNLPDPREPNTYYWYYGTLALYQQQGDAWLAWNDRVREVLVSSQRRDGNAAGSWDAEDQWATTAGRVYQTAICTLTLEVYYRYLPSFLKFANDAAQFGEQD